MKAVIIGYGAMGHDIERLLLERGHTVAGTIDAGEYERMRPTYLSRADVAIEFTTPSAAYGNVAACLRAGLPVVSGTTGWSERRREAEELCKELKGTFLWSSNFSIGVNIAFRVNRFLARLMNRFPQYGVSMCEIHHTGKKDSPSGTAVTLAEDVMENIERISSWVNHETLYPESLGIVSVRKGDVAGIHEVKYESGEDILMLRHEAKGRRGFALGAVIAAEFAVCHKGVLSMDDIFDDLK